MPSRDGTARRSYLLFPATAAAVTAAIGDACMLYVAFGHTSPSSAPDLALPLLWLGTILGIASIPLYRTGYVACVRSLHLRTPATDTLLPALAILVAVFGCATHGLTGLDIYLALARGAATRSPDEALSALAPPVITGFVAALSCAVASAVLIRAFWTSKMPMRLAMCALTPAVGSIALALAAHACGAAGAYIGPMAPNLAHAIFFGFFSRVAVRRTEQ